MDKDKYKWLHEFLEKGIGDNEFQKTREFLPKEKDPCKITQMTQVPIKGRK